MVYEKARELGELILATDYGKILEEAKKNFEQNPVAKSRLEEYETYNKDYIASLTKKELTPEEMVAGRRKIDDMYEALQDETDLVRLLNAEKEFSDFVNSIMQILKLTISGEDCDGCNANN